MPGNSTIYFVPAHLVTAIPKPDEPGKINNAITLSGSQKWYYWHCTLNTLASNFKKNRSRAGSSYVHDVSGFIPGDHEDYVAMMEVMEDMRFIALRKDANGYFKLLGSLESPLEFEYDFKAPGSGRRGFSFKMSRECRVPEYFYEGTLETEDGFIDTSTDQTVIDFSGVTVIHANNSIVTS